LFDFAIYFFHNAGTAKTRIGIYLYLPKLEHYWKRAFGMMFCESRGDVGDSAGSIKATVLIEHPGAFQMSEILYELRHHSSGLNCGSGLSFQLHQDVRKKGGVIVPDRAQVT